MSADAPEVPPFFACFSNLFRLAGGRYELNGLACDWHGAVESFHLYQDGIEVPWERGELTENIRSRIEGVEGHTAFRFFATLPPLEGALVRIEFRARLLDGAELVIRSEDLACPGEFPALAEFERALGEVIARPSEDELARWAQLGTALPGVAVVESREAGVGGELRAFARLLLKVRNVAEHLVEGHFSVSRQPRRALALGDYDVFDALAFLGSRFGAKRETAEPLPIDRETAETLAPLLSGASLPAEPSRPRANDSALTELRNDRPVFVIGGGRSGTSITTRILNGAGVIGRNEGHVFNTMLHDFQDRLAEDAGFLKCLEQAGLGNADVYDALVYAAASAVRRAAGGPEWLDKTPDPRMIILVPELRRIYPLARFVYCKRHPVSNVLSRTKKFRVPIRMSLAIWRRCEEAWLRACEEVPANLRLEIAQEDLALAPARAARALSDFLGMKEEQEKKMVSLLRNVRVEDTSGVQGDVRSPRRRIERMLVDLSVPSVDELEWEHEDVAYYREHIVDFARRRGFLDRKASLARCRDCAEEISMISASAAGSFHVAPVSEEERAEVEVQPVAPPEFPGLEFRNVFVSRAGNQLRLRLRIVVSPDQFPEAGPTLRARVVQNTNRGLRPTPVALPTEPGWFDLWLPLECPAGPGRLAIVLGTPSGKKWGPMVVPLPPDSIK